MKAYAEIDLFFGNTYKYVAFVGATGSGYFNFFSSFFLALELPPLL